MRPKWIKREWNEKGNEHDKLFETYYVNMKN